MLARGTPLGRPEWEGSTDVRWRPADRGAVQVDSFSTPGRDGGENRVKREREAVLTGEIWGAIGDRSGGREKRNERSRKKVGLDKGVIVKKLAESRVRAVTD